MSESAMQTPFQHSLLSQPHNTSDDLPSIPYQFSRWFELETRQPTREPSDGGNAEQSADTNILLRGSNLLSPRVREGPANVPSLYASHSTMYCKRMQDWKDHRNMLEDWEHTEAVNLSYQDLGDDYQLENIHRCLNRLIVCKRLQLMNNSLSDIKRVTLPSCLHLNLSQNKFSSFKSLPKAPTLEHLSMADNSVASLRNLSALRSKYPYLKTLVLRGNPAANHYDYRHRVFQVLPSLELFDGYPSLPSDKDLLSSHSSASCSSCTSTRSNQCTLS